MIWHSQFCVSPALKWGGLEACWGVFTEAPMITLFYSEYEGTQIWILGNFPSSSLAMVILFEEEKTE